MSKETSFRSDITTKLTKPLSHLEMIKKFIFRDVGFTVTFTKHDVMDLEFSPGKFN